MPISLDFRVDTFGDGGRPGPADCHRHADSIDSKKLTRPLEFALTILNWEKHKELELHMACNMLHVPCEFLQASAPTGSQQVPRCGPIHFFAYGAYAESVAKSES
ncbi:MAG: hypothetical protein CMJ46_08875 [Planctomyces sp.]|nr:hypothetical protein [Planctomyces sp.]